MMTVSTGVGTASAAGGGSDMGYLFLKFSA